MGFLEQSNPSKRKRLRQLIASKEPRLVKMWTSAVRAPSYVVASVVTFRTGNSDKDFHRVPSSDISPLQGECAAVVQALRDTVRDVPLLISCHNASLGTQILERVLQGAMTPPFAQVNKAWPLVEHIQRQCAKRPAEVQWEAGAATGASTTPYTHFFMR